ncbi:hypothetical protein FO519_000132 [Halicephalobus sp. NKZ332]|nr:hypothetical protein FO519_000132 [Halicephalobus sp. NKZ332]
MKLFLLLIFCLISCSTRADEDITTTSGSIFSGIGNENDNAGTPVFSFEKVNSEETTTAGSILAEETKSDGDVLRNEEITTEGTVLARSEETTTEGAVVEKEEIATEEVTLARDEEATTEGAVSVGDGSSPDESTPVAAGVQHDDGELLPNTIIEEPSTTEAITPAEQDKTAILMPGLRSEDGSIVPANTMEGSAKGVFPDIIKLAAELLNNANEQGSINWNKISSSLMESFLRNSTNPEVANTKVNDFIKTYASRLVEAVDRAENGQPGAVDKQLLQILTSLPKDMVERMVNENSFGLTPQQGAMIKKFYDDALARMGEMQLKSTTMSSVDVQQFVSGGALVESTTEKAVVEQETSSTVPLENTENKEAKEDLKKEDDPTKFERVNDSEEQEAESMDKNKMILIFAIASGCVLFLLCGGLGLCCYMRKRARSGRSNFKA